MGVEKLAQHRRPTKCDRGQWQNRCLEWLGHQGLLLSRRNALRRRLLFVPTPKQWIETQKLCDSSNRALERDVRSQHMRYQVHRDPVSPARSARQLHR